MALFGLPGISEGLELLLLLFAIIILALLIVRRVMFSLRLREVRRENIELARHMKKRLKTARLRSLDEIYDEQDDEMFRGVPVRAKAPLIPASYEARVGKTMKKVTRKNIKKPSKKKPLKTARQKKTRKAR